MRPIYERARDRWMQGKVLRQVFEGLDVVERQPFDALDADVLSDDGFLVCVAEVKCRTFPAARFPDYMIAETKVRAAEHEAALWGIPVWLIVQWTDDVGIVRLDRVTEMPGVTFAEGGRTDRGDPLDREPVVLIPLSLFVFPMIRGVMLWSW